MEKTAEEKYRDGELDPGASKLIIEITSGNVMLTNLEEDMIYKGIRDVLSDMSVKITSYNITD